MKIEHLTNTDFLYYRTFECGYGRPIEPDPTANNMAVLLEKINELVGEVNTLKSRLTSVGTDQL